MNRIQASCICALFCLLWGFSSHATGLAMTCQFDKCTARVTGASLLEVNCSEKQIYRGAYELNSDFQNTVIEAENTGDPKFTFQGAPTLKSLHPAKLTIANKDIQGTCTLEQ